MHPEYHGDKYEQEKNSEAMTDLLTMCEKVHCKGSDKALKAVLQWTELYKGRNGVFENKVVFNLAKDADPVLWWKTWGSATCPELTTVAMRVLAQPCSASSAERVWSAYERVHTDETGCRRIGPRSW